MKTTTQCRARRVRALLAGAVLLPLTACDDEGGGILVPQRPGPSVTFTATIVAPEIVTLGAQVPISLQLQNPATQPVTLPMISVNQQVVFDVEIVGADGVAVWNRLPPGQPVPGTTAPVTIAAGGFLSLPSAWDMRLPGGAFVQPGTFTIRARALAPDGDIVAAPRTIIVQP